MEWDPWVASYMAVAPKTGIPKWNPGKWKHGPTPAVCPSCLILSHPHIAIACEKHGLDNSEAASELLAFCELLGK